MARYWLHGWRFRDWDPKINPQETIRTSSSNRFRWRGISAGDVVYIVSLDDGHLFLGGRMIVERLTDRREAVRIFKTDDLVDPEEWIIARRGSGTRLDLKRRLSPALAGLLRFVDGKKAPKPFLMKGGVLHNQATRSIRELTLESASILDRVIDATDPMPKTGKIFTVTEAMLRGAKAKEAEQEQFSLPEEIVPRTFKEGDKTTITVNRYERDPGARTECVRIHGCRCSVCGMNFGERYGLEAEGHIHVHHLDPMANAKGSRRVDPKEDLRPICPNCHAVLHLGGQCRTIKDVKDLMARATRQTL